MSEVLIDLPRSAAYLADARGWDRDYRRRRAPDDARR